ncbi:23S rRNA (uracil-C(5))-methyltransferase RlmCD [Peptococcaceae bacterium CEB3]|nr:23S rRNA (uracil-C(5))-methyltransferase RlmCD [Peptococcaceae bacterium CEB3]
MGPVLRGRYIIPASCRLARDVYGIEENPFAVEDARRNADLNGFRHVQFLQGKVEDNLPRLPLRPDVVIMDPPRAGVTAAVIDHIQRSRPGKIIYVSCDPATLARDLSRIVRGGYQVSFVQPVDMFPWTRHVETVVLMSRAYNGASGKP